MAHLDCAHETLDGVTLVECRLASEASERVTLETTHEGPIWPPRRQGVPEAGWDEHGWTGVVSPDRPLALGYATPADPEPPAIELVASDPAPEEREAPAPRAVLRALGDPRPPRDVVEPDGGPTQGGGGTAPSRPATEPRTHDTIEDELDAIERRLDRAERLGAVDSVDAARSAVEDVGGIGSVRALVAQLDRDRDTLECLDARIAALRDRSSVDVPVADLERLV